MPNAEEKQGDWYPSSSPQPSPPPPDGSFFIEIIWCAAQSCVSVTREEACCERWRRGQRDGDENGNGDGDGDKDGEKQREREIEMATERSRCRQ
eukprot:2987833-Rhodomonas_salina.2